MNEDSRSRLGLSSLFIIIIIIVSYSRFESEFEFHLGTWISCCCGLESTLESISRLHVGEHDLRFFFFFFFNFWAE